MADPHPVQVTRPGSSVHVRLQIESSYVDLDLRQASELIGNLADAMRAISIQIMQTERERYRE